MTLGLLPICALDAFVELWTRAQALLVLSLTHAVYTHPVQLQAMALQQAASCRSLATELTFQLCRGLHKGLSSVAVNPPDAATLQYSSPCCGDP